jgi:hypothetical protein
VRRLRLLSAIAVLALGWVLPAAAGVAIGAHVAEAHGEVDHHAVELPDAVEALVHGHFHDQGTPDHDHESIGTSLAARAGRDDGPAPADLTALPRGRSSTALPGSTLPRLAPADEASRALHLLHCALLD